VTDGTADLGFIEGPRPPRSLRSRVIGHDRLAIVVPPGHPWARRRGPVSAAELAATPLVRREDGSGTSQTLTVALAAAIGADSVQAPAALSVSSTSAVRAAVLAGAAPAVITGLAVADDLATGRLNRIEIPELDLNRPLRAIWNGSANPPAGPARELVAHILTLQRKAGQPTR
jgi:DNA-binding transcriptional LysR family regulator